MGEIIKMILVLSLICGLSGLSLATLKESTAQRIEEQKLVFVQGPALHQVFGDAENDPVKDRRTFTTGDGREVIVFPAMVGGRLAGVAFETFGEGYGGELGVMVGVNLSDEKLAGIGITTMKETPGLGSKVTKHGFTNQFKGHALERLALTSQGGTIQGVSGASISSGAAMNAVREAVALYRELKDDIAAAWPAS